MLDIATTNGENSFLVFARVVSCACARTLRSCIVRVGADVHRALASVHSVHGWTVGRVARAAHAASSLSAARHGLSLALLRAGPVPTTVSSPRTAATADVRVLRCRFRSISLCRCRPVGGGRRTTLGDGLRLCKSLDGRTKATCAGMAVRAHSRHGAHAMSATLTSICAHRRWLSTFLA